MPTLTVSEFAESVGLNGSGTDYVGAGVMLRLLQSKGLAKEIKGGKRDHDRGRPKQLYEIADSVYDILGGKTVVEVKVPKFTVAEVLKNARTSGKTEVKPEVVAEKVAQVAEAQAPEQVQTPVAVYHWDEDED